MPRVAAVHAVALGPSLALASMFVTASTAAFAQGAPAPPAPPVIHVGYADVLARAASAAPDLAVARSRQGIARAEIGVAGTYPNPSVFGGTSTQTAKVYGGASIPLVIFGQRGAAVDAARAELATVAVEGEIAAAEVRAQAARAYVTLWLAEKTADARTEQAELVGRLEAALQGRIDVGSAPMVEGLRLRAEHLRAAADAREAATLVDGAGAELGRWLGVSYGPRLRARDEPPVPRDAPSLATLLARLPRAPAVRREEADERAAEARAARERALVRPGMTLDLSVEAYDPTLPATNYRAQLAVELPLFNQRGAYVERELSAAAAARARAAAERTRAGADLVAAYQQFVAVSERVTALEQAVVPAADAAAAATEEAYGLGRSPLVAVLDAEKARIDARLSLLEGRAVRAIAWVDVERALGERGP